MQKSFRSKLSASFIAQGSRTHKRILLQKSYIPITVVVFVLGIAAVGAAPLSGSSADAPDLSNKLANENGTTVDIKAAEQSSAKAKDSKSEPSSVKVKAEVNYQNSANKSEANVSVNGEELPIPENGEVHKTIETPGGQVEVHIEAKNNQTNDDDLKSRSRNSSDINIKSRSSSESNIRIKETTRIRSD